jgi:hypothetical protein
LVGYQEELTKYSSRNDRPFPVVFLQPPQQGMLLVSCVERHVTGSLVLGRGHYSNSIDQAGALLPSFLASSQKAISAFLKIVIGVFGPVGMRTCDELLAIYCIQLPTMACCMVCWATYKSAQNPTSSCKSKYFFCCGLHRASSLSFFSLLCHRQRSSEL